MQAAGACSVPLIPLVDLCDLATGYKDTVTQSIGNAAEAALTDKAVRDMVGAQIRAQLDALHIGTVRNVAIDGDNVIIVE